ncbi:hypothetical protein ACFWH7_17540 [Cellulosimicrobium cellulans]|uniref:hypothetical protein n=1 Tax=Cellulosimicrobium cellulans TaxID=1710 RepID=UPI003647443D
MGQTAPHVGAALAAGATPVLVPTPVTRPEEVAAAPRVATDLADAVRALDDRLPGAAAPDADPTDAVPADPGPQDGSRTEGRAA